MTVATNIFNKIKNSMGSTVSSKSSRVVMEKSVTQLHNDRSNNLVSIFAYI